MRQPAGMRRRFRWPDSALLAVVVLGLETDGCDGSSSESALPQPASGEDPPAADTPIRFARVVDWRSSEDSRLVRELAPSATAASTASERFQGGIAAANIEDDIDVYLVGGGSTASRLDQNQGDGVFAEIAADVGLAVTHRNSGPAFGDIDGDAGSNTARLRRWIPQRIRGIRAASSIPKGRYVHGFRQRLRLDRSRQDRGLAGFGAERDGDIDLVLTNSDDNRLVYHRNDWTAEENHYPGIRRVDDSGNRHGIGAKITVTTVPETQVRDMRSGNNYTSRDPFEVHFSLDDDTVADRVVAWPDGEETSRSNIEADQLLTIRQD